MRAFVDASPASACVLFTDGTRIMPKELAEAHSKYTNNEAEYRAVLLALYIAKLRKYPLTEIISDSQLVVRQLNGEYAIKKPELGTLAAKVWSKTGAIHHDGQLLKKGNVTFIWVRREDNPAGKELR